MTRVLLAAAVLVFAVRSDAHEGWGIVAHPQLGIVFADIPGNTIWRAANGEIEPLVRDVHSQLKA